MSLEIQEKLTIYIEDENGNLVETKEYKPPSNLLEKFSNKLGFKLPNTVSDSGLNAMAKRWVGISQNPVKWIAARYSTGSDPPAGDWEFRSAETAVTGANAYIRNKVDKWAGTASSYYDTMGGAYNNNTNSIVSYIDTTSKRLFVVMAETGMNLWAEIEFTFS